MMADPRASVQLPPDAVAELKGLWRSVAMRAPLAVPRERLRETARVVARCAQRELMWPEQLVVALKESWCSHPEFRVVAERDYARAVLADFVSMCIREYYLASPSRPVAAVSDSGANPHAGEGR